MTMKHIEQLPREKLLELLVLYAKNWLAHDGLWFQSIETKRGMDEALEHDLNAWRKFTVVEARRIKQFLDLPERPGLEGLRLALSFRLYAPLNSDETRFDGEALIYDVRSCRVQTARERKNMPWHPCKPVALEEYAGFARTIDDRIVTECVSCYPDIAVPTSSCVWRFSISAAKQ